MSCVDEAIRIDHTEVFRNVRALSDARFLQGAKLEAELCARSIKPFERGRPRGGRGPYGN